MLNRVSLYKAYQQCSEHMKGHKKSRTPKGCGFIYIIGNDYAFTDAM